MKKYFIYLFILFCNWINAQNLVPNASFEDTIKLFEYSTGYSGRRIDDGCKFWYGSAGGIPDYFHLGFNQVDSAIGWIEDGNTASGIPNNYFANNLYPRTGIAYAGISLLLQPYPNNSNPDTTVYLDSCFWREILGVNLLSHLIEGKCYKVQLYLHATFRRTSLATDAFDVYFASLQDFSYYDYGLTYNDSLDYLIPGRCGALYNSFLHFSPPQLSTQRGHFYTDTTRWEKVEFEYIADGTEVQMSLGYLRPNLFEESGFLSFPITNQNLYDPIHFNSVYLFIDDVSVYPCDALEYPADIGIEDTCINKGSPIVLGGLPKEEYLYWWYDSHDSLISRQSSITVYPTQDTSFVLVQKDFKFDETRDTVHIKVGNCLPLPPDYSGYDFAIYPNPNYGDFQVRFNTAVPEGAVLELYDLLGRKLAEYPLSGSGNIANINGIEVSSAIYYATVVVPNSFRKSVKMVIMK